MIHSFSVSNYGSIREETTLDLRIPQTAPDLKRFRQSTARPDVRLPTAIVLVGPNGSGKTTLLRALATTIRIACESGLSRQRPVKTLVPFLSKAVSNEPTRFRVEFEMDSLLPEGPPSVYCYELSVRVHDPPVGDPKIVHEALLHFPKGRRRRLFERGTTAEPIYVAHELGITARDHRLKAVREDASVLATFALLNVPFATQIVTTLETCLLSTNIVYHGSWSPPTETVIELLERNPDITARMKKAMQRSDLAIQDLRTLDGGGGGKQVLFYHDSLDWPVPLPFESGGTRRFFHMWPLFDVALTHGVPAVIDEIDGYLHVDMVSEILQWFQSRETNPHSAQLLVTSHNVGLLDDLEKEELFIVEKGENGGTRVHGAQDVRGLRRDTRLYPKYRSGVLGGLPKIG